MIVKILGIIDILTGLLFWMFGIFGVGNKEFVLLLGMIVLIKGVVFIVGGDVISVLDIISGGIVMLSGSPGSGVPKIIVIIVSLFLLQKGGFSLVS